MKRKAFERQLKPLQLELVRLQEWIKHEGLRVCVIFEGRDAAGKGGIIKRITARTSARVFRVVALPKPNGRERTQWYFQRYVSHLPAAGEAVLFDRSWYNRAGVEPVMGFCTPEQHQKFLRLCPDFERSLVESGVHLVKYWLTVAPEQQRERFQERIDDPRKHWKLSPIDLEAQSRWYAYSRARDAMLEATDTDAAPWYVVDASDQRRARLNCIAHLLSLFPYRELPHEAPELPAVDDDDRYDDAAALTPRRWVPQTY